MKSNKSLTGIAGAHFVAVLPICCRVLSEEVQVFLGLLSMLARLGFIQ